MSIGAQSRNNYSAVMQVLNTAGVLAEPLHLDIRPTLVNIVQPDNSEFVVSASDNWSHLAWRKLGNGRFWWIIADWSGVVDPFLDILPVQTDKPVTYLAVGTAVGLVSNATVTDGTQVQVGQTILVEDLDPSNPDGFFTSTILAVNATTGVISFSPVTMTVAIPAALSVVSLVQNTPASLKCPSPKTAFFQALNFGNPLNVLVP